jgi:hypothetical protein
MKIGRYRSRFGKRLPQTAPGNGEQWIGRTYTHGVNGQFLGARSTAGAEEGAGRELGAMNVFLDGLRRDGIEPDHAMLVALFMQANRGFTFIQVKILHPAVHGEAVEQWNFSDIRAWKKIDDKIESSFRQVRLILRWRLRP